MHVPVARLGLLALASTLPAAAQAVVPPAVTVPCPANLLPDAAAHVAVLRSQLRREAVPADDPAVPLRIASLLAQFKDALATATGTAFTCAPPTATTGQLQSLLADALHANQTVASDIGYEARTRRDVGAYGADLAVQIFQLFGKPKIFEVDLRYGIECGDDHLLLVFETPSEAAGASWRETLRWDAPHYATVGDALGDFVLLTPLTGSYQHPVWRYLVAHGHPGCGATPRPSQFSLDLLTPTSDPAKPVVSWHFDGAYSQGSTVPRLATTEDTIDFRLEPAIADETANSATPRPQRTTPVPPSKAHDATAAQEQTFLFHLDSKGQVVATPRPTGPGN